MPGHSYKGTASRPRSTSADAAPFLFIGTANRFNWTWTLPSPPNWGQYLPSDLVPAHYVNLFDGHTRLTGLGTSGVTYVFVGLNNTATAFVTLPSNAVKKP
jgi:hypothetical protein